MATIRVISPEGKAGSIPEEKINAALARGFKLESDVKVAEPIEPAISEPSKTESAIRGAAQGATFGFADELAGAGGAGMDVLTGKYNLGDILTAYQKNRDESRAAYKAAEEANPLTYFAGEIGGGFLVPMGGLAGSAKALSAGAKFKNALKVGAAAGALGSAGSSEADVTKGEVGELAKDVGTGATLGGALGGTLEGAIQGGSKLFKAGRGVVEEFEHPKILEDVYEAGKKGVSIGDLKTGTAKEAAEAAEALTEMARGHQADTMSGVKHIQKVDKTPIDIQEEVKNVLTLGDKIKESVGTSQDVSAINKIQSALGDLIGLKPKIGPDGVPIRKTVQQMLAETLPKFRAQNEVDLINYTQETLRSLSEAKGWLHLSQDDVINAMKAAGKDELIQLPLAGGGTKGVPKEFASNLYKKLVGVDKLKEGLAAKGMEDSFHLFEDVVNNKSYYGGYEHADVDLLKPIIDKIKIKNQIDVENSFGMKLADNSEMKKLMDIISNPNVEYKDRLDIADRLVKMIDDGGFTKDIMQGAGGVVDDVAGAPQMTPEAVKNNLFKFLMYRTAGKGTKAVSLPTDAEGRLVTELFDVTKPNNSREAINIAKQVIGDFYENGRLDKLANEEVKDFVKKSYNNVKQLARKELDDPRKDLWNASDEMYQRSIDALVDMRIPDKVGEHTSGALETFRNQIETLAGLIKKADKTDSAKLNSFNNGLKTVRENMERVRSEWAKYALAKGVKPLDVAIIDKTFSERVKSLNALEDQFKQIARRESMVKTLTGKSTLGQSNPIIQGLGVAATSVPAWGTFAAGHTERVAKKIPGAVLNYMAENSPDRLNKLAADLTTKGSKYGKQLAAALNAPKSKRNALLFSLTQQPAFRESAREIDHTVFGED